LKPPSMEDLKKDMELQQQALYPGSTMTDIEFCISVLQMKTKSKQSISSVNAWLNIIGEVIPHATRLPHSWEEVKRRLRQWGTTYKKIDACPCMEHVYTGKLIYRKKKKKNK
jgi:hypothetical protein